MKKYLMWIVGAAVVIGGAIFFLRRQPVVRPTTASTGTGANVNGFLDSIFSGQQQLATARAALNAPRTAGDGAAKVRAITEAANSGVGILQKGFDLFGGLFKSKTPEYKYAGGNVDTTIGATGDGAHDFGTPTYYDDFYDYTGDFNSYDYQA